MPEHSDPHQGQLLRRAGVPIGSARGAAILLHGRGGSADDILGVSQMLAAPGFAYLAPQARGNSWYPRTFLSPIEQNEPELSSALRAIANLVALADQHGIPSERLVIMGFSQGACLALEFSARHARRYGGIVAWSGGLIGPPGTPRDYAGSLEGTPVFIGCSDVDAHIPIDRVRESAAVLRRMGADVDERIYPGMGHTINREELDAAERLLRGVSDADR
jgi:predicted esterase